MSYLNPWQCLVSCWYLFPFSLLQLYVKALLFSFSSLPFCFSFSCFFSLLTLSLFLSPSFPFSSFPPPFPPHIFSWWANLHRFHLGRLFFEEAFNGNSPSFVWCRSWQMLFRRLVYCSCLGEFVQVTWLGCSHWNSFRALLVILQWFIQEFILKDIQNTRESPSHEPGCS